MSILNNNISEFINQIPKAELHLHIEGTFEPELMFEIAGRNHVRLSYKNVEELRNAYNFNNLQQFLDLYYIGSKVLQKEVDFYELTMAYLRKAASQKVVHAEIFFDPQTHLENNVSFDVFFKAIYEATVDAEKKYHIHSELIMCFLRHLSEESAFETLEKAQPYKDKILGIGLDSSELGNPPIKFKNLFAKAKKQGYKLVAHAGEEGPADYIRDAIDHLDINRIDHGNQTKDDEHLLNEVVEKRIPLTMCPLSNLKLAVVKDMKDHPLKSLMEKNVFVTVNSDDPAYFGGYINENLHAVQQALNLSKKDIILLAKNSFDASFISQDKKDYYHTMIDNFVKNFNHS
jgi:adenine deaminase